MWRGFSGKDLDYFLHFTFSNLAFFLFILWLLWYRSNSDFSICVSVHLLMFLCCSICALLGCLLHFCKTSCIVCEMIMDSLKWVDRQRVRFWASPSICTKMCRLKYWKGFLAFTFCTDFIRSYFIFPLAFYFVYESLLFDSEHTKNFYHNYVCASD